MTLQPTRKLRICLQNTGNSTQKSRMLVNRMSAAAIFYLTLVAATPFRPTLLICTSLPTSLLLHPTLIYGLVHKSNALITTGLLTLPCLRTIVLPTRDMTLGSTRCGPAISPCLAPAEVGREGDAYLLCLKGVARNSHYD